MFLSVTSASEASSEPLFVYNWYVISGESPGISSLSTGGIPAPINNKYTNVAHK